MIRWIVGWSLKFPLLVLALAVAMISVGITQLRSTPVDALPEFAPPYVEVQTEALGLSASEVEELITLNQEELLNGTPWLQSIHSTSVAGLSSIILTFKPGTDIIRARQLVSERLSLAYALPNVAQPPVILQPQSATSRVMMVGLSSPGDLAQVNVEGTKLRLGDVATVVEDHQPLIGDDILNNGSGLLFVIEKFPGANTLDVTRGVEAKLTELQPGLSGIQIDTGIF